VSLSIIDQEWKEHLREMDDLKQSVQNAVFEQKDPLLVYKFESVELFKRFLSKVNFDTINFLSKSDIPVEAQGPNGQEELEQEIKQAAASGPPKQQQPELHTNKEDDDEPVAGGPQEYARKMASAEKQAPVRNIKVTNRNERVNVQYADGTVKRDVKYKTVENDIESGRAVLIE
jgi:preprotein translocase subunit SecA